MCCPGTDLYWWTDSNDGPQTGCAARLGQAKVLQNVCVHFLLDVHSSARCSVSSAQRRDWLRWNGMTEACSLALSVIYSDDGRSGFYWKYHQRLVSFQIHKMQQFVNCTIMYVAAVPSLFRSIPRTCIQSEAHVSQLILIVVGGLVGCWLAFSYFHNSLQLSGNLQF